MPQNLCLIFSDFPGAEVSCSEMSPSLQSPPDLFPSSCPEATEEGVLAAVGIPLLAVLVKGTVPQEIR